MSGLLNRKGCFGVTELQDIRMRDGRYSRMERQKKNFIFDTKDS